MPRSGGCGCGSTTAIELRRLLAVPEWATLRSVADFCTCGAELPPDARFCHKCGKPQREEAVVVPEPVVEFVPLPVAVPVAPAVPVSTDVSLHDRPAVLSALTAALIGLALMMMVFLPAILRFASPVVSGFLAVLIYRRRTQKLVNIKNGLRLGWITGMLAFVITVIMFTLTMMVLLSDPQAVAMVKDSMKEMGSPKELDAMVEVLKTPAGILAWLASSFFTLTGLPMLGGALGATLAGKRPGA